MTTYNTEMVKKYILDSIVSNETEDKNKNSNDFLFDYYLQVCINQSVANGFRSLKSSIIYTIQGVYKSFDFMTYDICSLIDLWIPNNNFNDSKKEKLFYEILAAESIKLFKDLKKDFDNLPIKKQLELFSIKPEDVDIYATDLYVKKSFYAEIWLNQYNFKKNVTTFKDEIDNKIWYDIPFGNM